jgi:anti-sigma factor RsiW
MNGCSNLREQLEDFALGAEVTPELSDHLAQCDECATELKRQRALLKRIDGAVYAIVRAEPPAQLRIDVTEQLMAVRGPASRNPLRRWSAALAAAAIFALIVTVGFRAFERPPVAHSELSALSSWRSPTASLLEPVDIAPQSQPTPGATHES